MHRTLVEKASYEQLKVFVMDTLSMLKETQHDLYEDLELHLYKSIYGKHFSNWLLEKATRDMINEDGTHGPHWSVEETTSVAKSMNIIFREYNEYDWNYTMNMIYSDYYGAVSDEVSIYASMAKKFLMDKDAKEGKALCYYLSMR